MWVIIQHNQFTAGSVRQPAEPKRDNPALLVKPS